MPMMAFIPNSKHLLVSNFEVAVKVLNGNVRFVQLLCYVFCGDTIKGIE